MASWSAAWLHGCMAAWLHGWLACLDVKMTAGIEGDFPIRMVADQDRQIAKALGLIDQDQPNHVSVPITCRAVFVIGPDKRLRMSMVYPSSCGHNFEEILRSIDSLFMVESWVVGTPADWKPGDDVMVVPSIPKKEESTRFPKGVTRVALPSGKDYMRLTPHP
ncbi:PRDX6 [Branchiostoma lanceolatum]|uniref:PRDX6 protein n=1 Tax=Branchiostoma lanceolatum TaxID=7740 RepID=A0A8K0EYF8_BRALA|nr:PRDX6 [Branchiostoma lanceolatum]